LTTLEDFRRFLRLALQEKSEYQIIAEASDGLKAVQQAGELHPDLILLDIGLPTLNRADAGDWLAAVQNASQAKTHT